jgi:hypothetical protein
MAFKRVIIRRVGPLSWLLGKKLIPMQSYAKTFDEIALLISEWQGCRAQAWEYTVSHGQFLIRLRREDDPNDLSLFLWCKNCHRVNFTSHWINSNLEVSTSQGEYGTVWLLKDTDNLSVSSGALFAFVSDDWSSVNLRDMMFGPRKLWWRFW